MAHAVPEPLSNEEIERICRRIAPSSALPGTSTCATVLAVSGGADSIALMHIFAEGTRAFPDFQLVVATVDHGLRAEAADEAKFVAAEAARLGLKHVTLVWRGPKPASGIQAKARQARYRLLGHLTLDQSATHKRLLTAHTLEDQAETVLMRLARGSGVEGLSGIASDWNYHLDVDPDQAPLLAGAGWSADPVFLHRPFLDISKSSVGLWRRLPKSACSPRPSRRPLAVSAPCGQPSRHCLSAF
jgi:tRNA(Ile)-lysidine synthetase-like protein